MVGIDLAHHQIWNFGHVFKGLSKVVPHQLIHAHFLPNLPEKNTQM